MDKKIQKELGFVGKVRVEHDTFKFYIPQCVSKFLDMKKEEEYEIVLKKVVK